MKKFLIVVDMQKDFIDGALGTKEAQAMVENALEKILSFDGEIIATMDTHSENYLSTAEGKKLPVPHCIAESDGWQLDVRIEEALKRRGYATLEKPGFGSTELPQLVRRMAGDEADISIEMIGLCTDICVVSNALLLKAAMPEVKISVDASCCAGVTLEKHLAALETMRSCQINVY